MLIDLLLFVFPPSHRAQGTGERGAAADNKPAVTALTYLAPRSSTIMARMSQRGHVGRRSMVTSLIASLLLISQPKQSAGIDTFTFQSYYDIPEFRDLVPVYSSMRAIVSYIPGKLFFL